MAVNKNFVVKNGFEVSNDLILANAQTRKVSVGHTNPRYTLDVSGGIGATDFYLAGVGTFANELNVGLDGRTLTVLGSGNSIGIGTALPRYLLDVRSPVSTGVTALYVQGDVRITGDVDIDDINLDVARIKQLIVSEGLLVSNTGLSTFNSDIDVNAAILISGISTFNDYVDINDSVDISQDLNVVGLTTLRGYVNIDNSVNITRDLRTAGIITASTVISSGASFSNLIVSGLSTFSNFVDINNSLDVSTNLVVGETTELGTVQVTSGIITAVSGIVTYYGDGNNLDLRTNPSTGIGIGTTGGLVGHGVTFVNFYGNAITTSFYNPVTGIATIFIDNPDSGIIGIGSTFPTFPIPRHGDLFYNLNYARIFVYYDEFVVGIGNDAYWIDAAPFTLGSLDSVFNVNTSGISIVGVVTATAFYGDGSNLTGTGSTVVDDATTNDTFFPVFTKVTSGIITASRVSTTKLTFNPSTGNLSVPRVSASSSISADQLFVTNDVSASRISIANSVTANQLFITNDVTANRISAASSITTGTITASIITANELKNAYLTNYSERIYNFGNTGSAPNINLNNGAYVIATLNQNAVFTFTMPVGIQTGVYGFVLQLKNGVGSLSITWPASVRWPQTSVPARTLTNGKTDIWSFITYDNGVTWLGNLALIDYNV